jgi:hypothetical protein
VIAAAAVLLASTALAEERPGAAGGLIGWAAGGASRTESVVFEGLPAESLEKIFIRLRKHALVPSLC